MSFSTGFNTTFRTLDNAQQWRSSQKENARQFDETLGETKRVNDSRIDVNAAQIGRLKALTSQVDQLVDYNEQANPKRLKNLDNQNVNLQAQTANLKETGIGLGIQNDINAKKRDEFLVTSDGRVAAAQADYALKEVDARLKAAEGRGEHAGNILAAFTGDDGTPMDSVTIASDPRLLSRFSATATASSAIFDENFGEDAIATFVPEYDNGELIGYYAVQEDGKEGKGAPLRADPDMVDENGEPRLISVEEAAQAVEAMKERLDSHASYGANDGTARQRVIGSMAQTVAQEKAGAAPTAPAIPQGMEGRTVEDLQAEAQQLQAEMAELDAQRQQIEEAAAPVGGRTIGQNGPGGVFGDSGLTVPGTLTEQEKAKVAELDARAQQLQGRLMELQAGANIVGQNRSLGQRRDKWRQGIEATANALTTRVNRGETLNTGNYTREQMDNLMRTGKTDVSQQDVIDLQKEAKGEFYEAIPKLAAFNDTDKNGKPYEVDLRDTVGSELTQQIRALEQAGDPYVSRMIKTEEGRNALMMAARGAVRATNGGRLPVVFSAKMTEAMEKVSADDMAKVTSFAVDALARKDKSVSPQLVEAAHIAAADEISARGSKDPLTQDEAKALAGRVLTRMQLNR